MVQFLIVVILVLFAGVQFFQWLMGIILPLPWYWLGGAFLAVASNYQRAPAPIFPPSVNQPLQQSAVLDSPAPPLIEDAE
ncbi:MAG: hypothetical protein ACK5CA_11640 [Cyanobacteriota bacterium]|jgi:hypothetical protein